MDLIILVLMAVLIGFLVWVVTTKVPMPQGWAQAIQVFALIVLLIWLLSHFIAIPNIMGGR